MSAFLRLSSRDFQKGLIVAVLTAVFPVLNEALQNGADLFSYDWTFIGKLAISAAVGYLLKNFLSDKDGKVLGRV